MKIRRVSPSIEHFALTPRFPTAAAPEARLLTSPTPPLHGVASRYTAGELRLRLVDPNRLNPDTVMPSYYTRGGLHRVAPEYRGRSIYSASEIEDLVAYLRTLSTK